jgi:large subunit ribosomal protein L21
MLDVERLPAEVGSTVELGDVLLVAVDGTVNVGAPRVEGARVIAEVVQQGRGDKIIVFKYKNKTRYRRRRGHRQDCTRLAIRQILSAGEEPAPIEAAAPKRAARKPKAEAAAEPAGQPAEAAAEAPASEAPPSGAEAKPARARRTAKAEKTGAAPAAAAKPARKPRPARSELEATTESGETKE